MTSRYYVPGKMKKRGGKFTGNLFGLQMQLKTLLEDAGGDELGELLDSLCELNQSEQKVVLRVFSRMVQKIINGDDRLETDGDLALKRFEDTLYEDLVGEMKRAVLALPNNAEALVRPKLEVVGNQRRVQSGEVVSLDLIRKARKESDDTLLN